jgi:hypothetical protein
MANWLDRMVRRVRDAKTTDEAVAVTHDYIDPNTGQEVAGGGGGDQDTHIHLHMNGKGDMEPGADAGPPPMNGNGNGGPPAVGDPAGGGDLAQLAARIAALEEQVQALMSGDSDEEDVELQDPDTQDARRFKMRRRGALRTGDEGSEIPVPERLGEEMVGETDLPGLEDLPQGGSTSDSRRRRAAVARTRDSMDQEDLWSDLVASAEIIAPGTRIPTFDARLPMKSTAERLCKYRRLVMEKAFKDAETAAIIQDTVGIQTYDGIKPLGCDSVKMAFNAVASAMAGQNNRRVVRTAAATPTRDSHQRPAGPPSIAKMNQQARDFWSNQKTNGSTRH